MSDPDEQLQLAADLRNSFFNHPEVIVYAAADMTELDLAVESWPRVRDHVRAEMTAEPRDVDTEAIIRALETCYEPSGWLKPLWEVAVNVATALNADQDGHWVECSQSEWAAASVCRREDNDNESTTTYYRWVPATPPDPDAKLIADMADAASEALRGRDARLGLYEPETWRIVARAALAVVRESEAVSGDE